MNPAMILALITLMIPALQILSPPPLDQIVATERAFSARSAAAGIRAAFLEFFAEDGVAFRPQPFVYKTETAPLPAPSDPHAVRLEWEPVAGDVSRSGDLGYTTGPYVLTDTKTAPSSRSYGYFFSVWRRQTDGSWRVVLDIGIHTPAPFPGKREFRRAGRDVPDKISVTGTRETLLEAERRFHTLVTEKGASRAYREFFTESGRLYRPGREPIVGRSAAVRDQESAAGTLRCETAFTDTSTAGDMGYAYGACRETKRDSVVSAYYARVWVREGPGVWRIAADVVNTGSK